MKITTFANYKTNKIITLFFDIKYDKENHNC